MKRSPLKRSTPMARGKPMARTTSKPKPRAIGTPSASAGSKHMGRVAELPCCLCGTSPVEVHHILEGRIKGRRSASFTTIPLCYDCHRGDKNGIHGQQAMLKIMKTTELELLAITLERLYG